MLKENVARAPEQKRRECARAVAKVNANATLKKDELKRLG